MRPPRVLIVDDEQKIRDLLVPYFRSDGYEVRTAADGPEALERFDDWQPDLVVLDVMLPGMDGIEVLRAIRRTSDVYVIMLTARAEEADTLVGLAVGADDYVTKPFSPRELLARAKTLFRRARAEPDGGSALAFDGFMLDVDRREVTRGTDVVELTTLEFDLLRALASEPGKVFTRRRLLERVWGYDFFGDERVVDVHIRNLRKALGDDAGDPRIIGTVRGVGYRLVAEPT